MNEEALYLDNIVTEKKDGQQLNYLSLYINYGEVTGVTGLNDSGLSVLADLLSGAAVVKHGKIFCGTKAISAMHKESLKRHGIHTVRCNQPVATNLSVEENICLSKTLANKEVFYNKKNNRAAVRKLMNQYNICCSLDMPLRKLSLTEQIKVSICGTIFAGARVIICRNLGAGASNEELISLKKLLADICRDGFAVVVLNSNVEQTLFLSDRIYVMKNGAVCYARDTREAVADEIYARMNISNYSSRSDSFAAHEQPYHITNLKYKDSAKSVDLSLDRGHITGLHCSTTDAGTHIHRLFSGLPSRRPMSADISADGITCSLSRWRKHNCNKIVCLDMYFWRTNIYENLKVWENIALRSFPRFKSRTGVLNERIIRVYLQEFVEQYRIPAELPDLYPRHLTIEQKNQISLWSVLFSPPGILVLNNPYFLIDEQTKSNLVSCLNELKKYNTAILWCSNNEPILNSHCDVIYKLEE